jgi:decaprenylphospho-beta-D-erythro-pentofuranosid-2-ulose 2-reductase
MDYVLIVGATSDIAKAIANIYAKKGYNLYLAARNLEECKAFGTDQKIKYDIDIECFELDILNFESHEKFFNSIKVKPIGVIVVVGYLGNQEEAIHNLSESRKIIDTNFTSVVNLLNIVADDFEKNKKGFIIGISSVAGDRGRQSNYLYGSAKAGFSAYLSGLQQRLFKSNVHVLNVKPGFVDTKMTKDLNLPKLLTANPVDVAKDIFKAQQKNKDIVYTKWFWKWIMLIIKSIPTKIFKKLSM